jgi:hypothetical protein
VRIETYSVLGADRIERLAHSLN